MGAKIVVSAKTVEEYWKTAKCPFITYATEIKPADCGIDLCKLENVHHYMYCRSVVGYRNRIVKTAKCFFVLRATEIYPGHCRTDLRKPENIHHYIYCISVVGYRNRIVKTAKCLFILRAAELL